MLVLPPEMQKPRAMKRILRLVVTSTVIAAWAAPARADDVATVCRKLQAAAAGVTSFVVQIQAAGTAGVSGNLTFVRPMRMKSELGIGLLSVESYLIDGTAYVHDANGWQKTKIDARQAPQQSANIADSMKPADVTLLPDRQEGGSDAGVFALETTAPAAAGPASERAPVRTVCSYDKSTYLLKSCANGVITMTYTRYNDAANSVVLPPEAKTAAAQ
jgi:hypothetical protein